MLCLKASQLFKRLYFFESLPKIIGRLIQHSNIIIKDLRKLKLRKFREVQNSIRKNGSAILFWNYSTKGNRTSFNNRKWAAYALWLQTIKVQAINNLSQKQIYCNSISVNNKVFFHYSFMHQYANRMNSCILQWYFSMGKTSFHSTRF